MRLSGRRLVLPSWGFIHRGWLCWWFGSVFVRTFEDMFDVSVPDTADLASLDDGEVVAAIGALTHAENAMCARKLAAMAELFRRRTGLAGATERDLWWVDPDAAVGAEIGAAGAISQWLALAQTHRGVALHDRLPAVARLFAQGLIGDLLVRTIVWRTALIESPAAMAVVDGELALRVTRWGALSQKKTEQAIDELIDEHDPAALRRTRAAAAALGVQFGSPTDTPGVMSIWARVHATDGVAIEARVTELAHRVCDNDPRTADERCSAAFSAAITHTELTCHCGDTH